MAVADPDRDEAQPHDRLFVRSLRRHAALIVAVTVLVTAAAAVVAYNRSAEYVATASVLLRPAPGNAFSSTATSSSQQTTVALTTEAALVESEPVIALAQETLDRPVNPRQVAGTVPPNSQIVQVQFTSPDADQARSGAQAVATALLEYRSEQTSDSQAAQLSELSDQRTAARERLREATQQAKSGSSEARELVDLYTQELSALATSLNTMVSTPTDPGTIIKPAERPSSAAGISPWMIALAGFLLGLALALSFAVWRERSDHHIRGSLSSLAGRPILARITWGPSPRALEDPLVDEELAESIRSARAAILATAPAPSVLAFSPADLDGDASLVALETGMSLTRAGYSMALVLTAPFPAVSEALGLEPGPGIVDVELAGVPVAKAVRTSGGIAVLPLGADTEQPDLFARASFRATIQHLKEDHDYVFVLMGPLSRPGGLDIVMATDGLVLTCVVDQTVYETVHREATQANELGVPVLGTILTRQRPPRRRLRLGRRAVDRPVPTDDRLQGSQAVPEPSPPAADPDPSPPAAKPGTASDTEPPPKRRPKRKPSPPAAEPGTGPVREPEREPGPTSDTEPPPQRRPRRKPKREPAPTDDHDGADARPDPEEQPRDGGSTAAVVS